MIPMKVRHFMSSDVETLSPESTLEEASVLEIRRKIRHIPILDNGQLVGIITDRDLKRAMPSLLTGTERAEHERVMTQTTVGQIMTKSPLTIAPDADLIEAVRLLCTHKFGALPVVQEQRLVGILTESDIMRAFLGLLEREA